MSSATTAAAAWSVVVVLTLAVLSGSFLRPEPFRSERMHKVTDASLGEASELLTRLQSMQQGMLKVREQEVKRARVKARPAAALPAVPLDDATTHVFFTGGIASTYLLCHLLLVERRVVCPVYISADIDHANPSRCRQSTSQELNASNAVLQHIGRRFPKASARLRPIHYEPFIDISSEIAAAHQIVFGRKVGKYAGLAQWSRDQFTSGKRKKLTEHPKRPLQLAIFLCNRTSNLHALIKENCERRGEGVDAAYVVQPAKRNTPFGRLFGHIVFRLVDLDGRRLHKSAQKRRFGSVLRRAWSCTAPNKARQPCGVCMSCLDRAALGRLAG